MLVHTLAKAKAKARLGLPNFNTKNMGMTHCFDILIKILRGNLQ